MAALSRLTAPLAAGFRSVGRGLGSLLARMLPGDFFQTVPSTFMAFTALAVPVVVVTVSSVVYLRLGRDAQYETLYAQAEQIAERAAGADRCGSQTCRYRDRSGFVEQS